MFSCFLCLFCLAFIVVLLCFRFVVGLVLVLLLLFLFYFNFLFFIVFFFFGGGGVVLFVLFCSVFS